jgi:hypothetical protein
MVTIVTGLAIKLGDTALWATIGALVLGFLLKAIQSIQTSLHRREDKPVNIKLDIK